MLNVTKSNVNDKSRLRFVQANIQYKGHQGTIQTLSKKLLIFYQS